MTDPVRPILIVGLPRSGHHVDHAGPQRRSRHRRRSASRTTRTSFPRPSMPSMPLGRYPGPPPGDCPPPTDKLWEWMLAGAHEDRRAGLARHLLGPGAEKRIHDGRPDPVTWLAAVLARNPRPVPPPAGRSRAWC